MQNRQDVGDADNEVGHLGAEKGYAFIDAVRVAFDVGALGLGVSGDISRSSSLTTVITVEGFCSFLSLIVAVHEIVNVCRQQCFRSDGRTVEATNHPVTQYSTYLSFRLASILSNMVGMSLMASDLAVDTTTAKTTIGLMMVSMGIFASRALSSSRQKPAGAILSQDDDIELGLLAGANDEPPPQPPAMMQQRQAQQRPEFEPVPLVADAAPVGNVVPLPRQQNQFFQPPAAPQGPAPERVRAPRRKVKVKVHKAPHIQRK